MSKQKLMNQAIELYRSEMKILVDEEKLLEKRKDLCFERFLDRCHHINEMSWWERKKEEANLDFVEKGQTSSSM